MMILTCRQVFGYVTLQDEGRVGQRRYGISTGGAADIDSARKALLLAGSPAREPVLEFAQAAARLHFSSAATVAWTGAAAALSVSNQRLKPNRRLRLEAGSVLDISGPYDGRYGYLGIAGHWVVERYRGSVSPIRLGHDWRPACSVLAKGDTLAIAIDQAGPKSYSSYVRPETRSEVYDVWPAPETAYFRSWIDGHPKLLSERLPRFGTARWRVLPSSNRVGLRLRSVIGAQTIATLTASLSIHSSPTLAGTVQVAPNGDLLVSLADGPTMGGYPRIAVVDERDLGRLAQCLSLVCFRFR